MTNLTTDDEAKVVTGLAQPAPLQPPPQRSITFSAEWVRDFPKRPYYEQEIEKAMWRNEQSTVLSYQHHKLAVAVRTRLTNLGFTCEQVRNSGGRSSFVVTW